MCNSFNKMLLLVFLAYFEFCFQGSSLMAKFALPNLEALGKPVADNCFFAIDKSSSDTSKAEYPRRVLADIYDGKIEGYVFSYSPKISLEKMAGILHKAEKDSKRYPELVQHGIWMWRNEKKRYTIQLAQSYEEGFGPQLVVVWLDRKRPIGEEAVEITKALIEDSVKPQNDNEESKESAIPQKNE